MGQQNCLGVPKVTYKMVIVIRVMDESVQMMRDQGGGLQIDPIHT